MPTKTKPPSPTLVLLVRHGSTPTTGKVLPGRAPGLHLSDQGREQAARVAERLAAWATAPRTAPRPAPRSARRRAEPPPPGTPPAAGEPPPDGDGPKSRIAAVYASPMERTRETAAPIAAALGLRTRTERGLLECDFGDWTGEELKKLTKLPDWATVQRYPSGFRFPGGESFKAMQARIVGTLIELCSRHPGQAIVAVSHADPIKAAVADALGSHLDLFQRIVISPCSVTAVNYGLLGPTVLAVNSTSGLAELVPS